MVPFSETLYPTGDVEYWLLEVERVMRGSLKQIIGDSLVDYQEVGRMCLIHLSTNVTVISIHVCIVTTPQKIVNGVYLTNCNVVNCHVARTNSEYVASQTLRAMNMLETSGYIW